MTKFFKRIIITAILLIAIAAGASALVLSGGCSAKAGDPLAGAKVGIVNTALDMTGIRDAIDSKLRSKTGEMADAIGVPREMADAVVDSLAIADWKATELPADVTPSGTYAVEYEGISASVTTYDDAGVVTVSAFGQDITMAVPAAAQAYVPYLRYLAQ